MDCSLPPENYIPQDATEERSQHLWCPWRSSNISKACLFTSAWSRTSPLHLISDLAAVFCDLTNQAEMPLSLTMTPKLEMISTILASIIFAFSVDALSSPFHFQKHASHDLSFRHNERLVARQPPLAVNQTAVSVANHFLFERENLIVITRLRLKLASTDHRILQRPALLKCTHAQTSMICAVADTRTAKQILPPPHGHTVKSSINS